MNILILVDVVEHYMSIVPNGIIIMAQQNIPIIVRPDIFTDMHGMVAHRQELNVQYYVVAKQHLQ